MLKRAMIVAALTGLGLGSVASADVGTNADAGDILGVWSFATTPYRDGNCTMTGTMHLTPDPESGVYDCELTAREVCEGWGTSIVRQQCTVRRVNNQVTVRSTIAEILESKGPLLENARVNYLPDNFALTVTGPSRMYGALVSAVRAPVEFTRSREGVS